MGSNIILEFNKKEIDILVYVLLQSGTDVAEQILIGERNNLNEAVLIGSLIKSIGTQLKKQGLEDP